MFDFNNESQYKGSYVTVTAPEFVDWTILNCCSQITIRNSIRRKRQEKTSLEWMFPWLQQTQFSSMGYFLHLHNAILWHRCSFWELIAQRVLSCQLSFEGSVYFLVVTFELPSELETFDLPCKITINVTVAVWSLPLNLHCQLNC